VPTHLEPRAATPDEIAAMQALLAQAPDDRARRKRGLSTTLVIWAAGWLIVTGGWLLLGWVIGSVTGTDLGLESALTQLIVIYAFPVSALVAIVMGLRWLRALPDYRPKLRADVDGAQVKEERYVFTEAKRFQEPEHGGLIYFLRSTSDEVLTVYDPESQSLGVQGQDPLQSRYRPQAELRVVRAPHSGFALSTDTAGTELPVSAPIPLTVAPRHWPQPDALCDIAWDQLEARLSAPTAAA
jgi:hypothetical protein